MSSSFGGGGGSGGRGEIYYSIRIDDSQVNSKLSNLQNQLGRIDSATRSSGAGLTTLNNNFQNMNDTLGNSTADLDAINNNFRTMDSSVQGTSRNMGALNNAFQNTSGGLNKFNTLQDTVGDGTRSLGDRMKTAGGYIRDNALAFGAVSSSVIGLVSNFTNLERARVSAERAEIMRERTQQRVVKLQEKLNKLFAEGKQGTNEYAIMQKDLEIAQDQAGVAADRARLAQMGYNEQLGQMGQQTIQDSILLVSGTIQMFSSIRDIAPLATKGIRGLASAIGLKGTGLIGGVTGLAAELPPVIALLKTLEVAWVTLPKELIAFDPSKSIAEKVKAMRDVLVKLQELPMFGGIFQGMQIGGVIKQFDQAIGILEKVDKPIQKINQSAGELGTRTLPPLTVEAEYLGNAIGYVGTTSETTAKQIDGVSNAMLGLSIATNRPTWEATSAEFEHLGESVANTEPPFKHLHDLFQQTSVKVKTTSKDWWAYNMGIAQWGNTANHVTIPATTALTNANIDLLHQIEDVDFALKQEAITIGEDLKNAFNEFSQKSHLDLFEAFDIKTPEERMQKGLQKFEKVFEKQLDKMHIKFDVDKVFDIEGKTEGFKMLAAKLIAGMAPFIAGNDKLADAFAQSLIALAPKGKEGDKIRAWLEGIIKGTDTAGALQDSVDSKNSTINIPAELSFGAAPGNANNSAEIETGGLGDSYVLNKLGIKKPVIIPAALSFNTSGQEWSEFGPVNDVPGPKDQISPQGSEAEMLKISSSKKSSGFDIMARQIDQITKNFNVMARAIVQVTKDFDQLARATVQNTKNNNTLARTIVTTTKDYNQLARTQVQVTKNNNTLARTIVTVGKDFNSAAGDAKKFASALHSVESAARAAAKAIKSIPKPPSGVSRFATGGEFITSGPELIMVGDNPSGKEHVKVTPLSGSPAGRFLYSNEGSDSGVINQTVSIRISGNDIINERNLSKKIRMELGRNRDRFG